MLQKANVSSKNLMRYHLDCFEFKEYCEPERFYKWNE